MNINNIMKTIIIIMKIMKIIKTTTTKYELLEIRKS